MSTVYTITAEGEWGTRNETYRDNTLVMIDYYRVGAHVYEFPEYGKEVPRVGFEETIHGDGKMLFEENDGLMIYTMERMTNFSHH